MPALTSSIAAQCQLGHITHNVDLTPFIVVNASTYDTPITLAETRFADVLTCTSDVRVITMSVKF